MTWLSRMHLLGLATSLALALVLPPQPAAARVSQPAGMATDAGDAVLPDALNNLGVARIYTPAQFGGVGDTQRATCTVTTTATSTNLSVSGCTPFVASDVGKILVVNNAGASATTPLVTTIAAYISSSHITMGNAAGQSLAGVSEPVTFGHDDAAAINACLTASVATGATQSYCYLPPASGGFWGAASAIELYPSVHTTTLVGAGRYRSQVVALAAMASLVHRAAGNANGGMLKDIGFDGDKLATDVGYFVCASLRHDEHVGFYNAAGDADLVYGDATGHAAGCNTNQVSDLEMWNMPAFYPAADLPSYNLIVGSTDNFFRGVVCREAATASILLQAGSAAANNTEMHGVHCFSPSATASTGILANALGQRLYGVDCDSGITTCIDIENTDVGVFGGYENNAAAVGVTIKASTNNVVVMGFDASLVATQANRIVVNTPVGTGLCTKANPGAIDNCSQIGAFSVLGNDNTTQFNITNTASAANNITVQAAAAGAAPMVSCTGGDTNINCRFGGKGAGTLKMVSHPEAGDTAAGTPTTCGSSPSVSGTDSNGIITVGTGTVTACTLPFGQTWLAAPKCVLTGIGTGSSIVSLNAAPTTGQFVIAASATIGGQKVAYRCVQ